jgi:glycosyltransferase involved in cell wall biosynthesis
VTIFMFAIGARDRASSRLRIWDHVEWLEARHETVLGDSLIPPAAEATRTGMVRRVLSRLPQWISAFFRSDAVVIQEALLLWPLLYLKNLGKQRRVLFDFSDPVDRHGRGLKGVLRRFAFRRMVRLSDVTMVENGRYLASLKGDARRLAHFYGPVNATRYAAARASPAPSPASPQRLRIGWTGSPGTYRFIARLMPIVDEIARDIPIEVMLIGVSEVDHVFRHATVSLVPWQEDNEFSLVPSFDLGLFRLESTADALWRGAGKLFFYMAAGIPFVASDIGIAHSAMAESDLGYPVAEDSDWESMLRKAARDKEGRSEMSARSLAYARERLSYEAYRQTLMDNLGGPGSAPA